MARRVILVTTALRQNATVVMILVISPNTAPKKLLHQRHPIFIIDLVPTFIISTAARTGHTPSISNVSGGTILPGQNIANDLPRFTSQGKNSLFQTCAVAERRKTFVPIPQKM